MNTIKNSTTKKFGFQCWDDPLPLSLEKAEQYGFNGYAMQCNVLLNNPLPLATDVV